MQHQAFRARGAGVCVLDREAEAISRAAHLIPPCPK